MRAKPRCSLCGHDMDSEAHKACIRRTIEAKSGRRNFEDPAPAKTQDTRLNAGLFLTGDTPDDFLKWARSMNEEDWLR